MNPLTNDVFMPIYLLLYLLQYGERFVSLDFSIQIVEYNASIMALLNCVRLQICFLVSDDSKYKMKKCL